MLSCGVWYPAGLCSVGSDTPQDFVKRGIIPCRTLFCGVSDPAEQVCATKCTQLCYCYAGSDTPQDLVLRGLIPRRVLFCGVLFCGVLFCGVWYPAGFCSVGSDTPQEFVLWGIRPHWQIKTPQNLTKKVFLPFPLKGPCSKIVCMYKLHYPRHIGSMLKEFPIRQFFCVPRGLIPHRTSLKFEYLREFENDLGYELGAHIGSIREKTRGQKSHATVPLSGM